MQSRLLEYAAIIDIVIGKRTILETHKVPDTDFPLAEIPSILYK